MDQISFEQGLDSALNSLLNYRLALLAGAGLSMAPPTNLRSAAIIATAAKRKYDSMYGQTRPQLSAAIEEQAEFFFARGELDSVYFLQLIDQHEFSGPPNPGHYAIADLLLVKALQLGITTNVDCVIEAAGAMLFGEIEAGIDGQSLAALPLNTAPLLKLHGCRLRDRPNMVWAPSQLTVPPVSDRIDNSAAWLAPQLANRDLLVVGYWTDWDYLNTILTRALGAVRPARITVITPDDLEALAHKAPQLLAIGENANVAFHHVQASGADFLGELRRKFSRSFVRRVLHSGAEDFQERTGAAADARWLEPAESDNELLWQIRRDLEGCLPNKPSLHREPPNGETLVGLTLLQLRAAGATADGSYWTIHGRKCRVLRAVGKPLHKAQREFERETAPAVAPEIVIAVGSEDLSLATDIARGTVAPSIARANGSRWLTRERAVEELAL